MKIKINLDAKSVQQAIKQFEKVKQDLETTMIREFIQKCCDFFIYKANDYLFNSNIGANVKGNIMNSWTTSISYGVNSQGYSGYYATITNTDEQAVYVEFGVGVVGSYLQHKEANTKDQTYEYNVPSNAKTANGQWVFEVTDEKDVDLEKGMYKSVNNKYGNMWIITKGSPATMYAFNALMDLKNVEMRKIWKDLKIKYWG